MRRHFSESVEGRGGAGLRMMARHSCERPSREGTDDLGERQDSGVKEVKDLKPWNLGFVLQCTME